MTVPGDQPADLSQNAIDQLVAQALAAFAAAGTGAELKAARLAHTGERSPLALANRAIGSIPGPERKDAGQRLGAARAEVGRALADREAAVGAAELEQRLAAERIDVTLPVELGPEGAQHPITALMDLMNDVFLAMGWEVAEGPEAEGEWLNFDALNIGPDHPARGTTDTLFVAPIENQVVLRTHTSPVQIRSMLDRPLPIYVVCPGKVYRADEFDATHVPVFHQIEGLCVDKGISLAHLKGTLDHLAKSMFGDDIETRMRPHYFPFTEPSAEVDLQCFVCHGTSVDNPDAPCRTCRSQGWIEWGGCGVVNPRVLAACGIDPDVYSGFAFGMGIERTLMFRNNAADMRDMVEGDVRFSRSLKGLAR
jgi:phenylalanyl-tRNA synthetase alpha chain